MSKNKKTLYKNKILILLLVSVFLTPLISALEECQREQEPKNIPCQIISTWNYSKPCSIHTADSYYENGSFIQTNTFEAHGATDLCRFTWNITEEGTYNYVVDTGETGGILVKKFQGIDDRMMTIIFALSIIIIYFGLVGLFNLGSWISYPAFFFSFIELVYMLGIIYVDESGGALIGLLQINFYVMSIVGIGLGLLSLIGLLLRSMDFEGETQPMFQGSRKFN